MLGFVLLGSPANFAILIFWIGAALMRRYMRGQCILQHGMPGRVRVVRAESYSLLVADGFQLSALTVEIL